MTLTNRLTGLERMKGKDLVTYTCIEGMESWLQRPILCRSVQLLPPQDGLRLQRTGTEIILKRLAVGYVKD